MTSTKSFCVECRGKITPQHNENHTTHTVSSRWRAPRINNDSAWKRIAAGEIWWDRKAISRKAVKGMRHWNNRMFRGKEAVLEELEQRRKAARERINAAIREKEIGPPECKHDWCMWSYKQAIKLSSNREDYEGCPRGPMDTTELS